MCSVIRLLQSFVEHEIHFVVAESLLEVGDVGLLVDLDVLDANHLGEVLPVLLVDVVGLFTPHIQSKPWSRS